MDSEIPPIGCKTPWEICDKQEEKVQVGFAEVMFLTALSNLGGN